MSAISEISIKVQTGRFREIAQLVENALKDGISPSEILSDGLIHGMGVVGEKFKNNQVFIPEVMMSARAMQTGLDNLKPYFDKNESQKRGRVCIGTVKGDQHDIGKNLVKIMMEGRGIEVVDLGVNVEPSAFISAVKNQDCAVICCSALLTSTMPQMQKVVDLCVEEGIREGVKIMVGGAPLSADYAKKIGADGYAPDAASAADKVLEFLGEQ